MTIPSWVFDSVFYQIFPDRFYNGDLANDPPNKMAWGTPPDIVHFQGGDLIGVQKKLDYLLDLGVNAIYLNPIFLSPSTHRYNTVDYYQIDPKLGKMKDFQSLLSAAHSRGMRVILDGVFNHCGRGFFAFNDILENDGDSPYYNWFHIQRFPLQAFSGGKSTNYTAWWGFKSLPKFNTDHPPVRQYIFDVAKYWIEQGIDGWRLDVPGEIDDDAFWAEFRHTVRFANPEAYLVGEIWEVNRRWVGDSHFDGLMNYPVRTAILALLNGAGSSNEFIDAITRVIDAYPLENLLAMYSLLGSHDVERVRTILGGSIEKTRLANTLLFGLPGVPAIYYGDEVGMEGGRDPDCRRAFPWDEKQWQSGLREHLRQLIQIRKAYPALRRGQIQFPAADQVSGGIVWLRTLESNRTILIAANPTASEQTITVTGLDGIPMEGYFPNLLDENRPCACESGKLVMPMAHWGGGIFVLPD